MSPDEFTSILNQYALDQYVLFAIGLLVVVVVGLLLRKRLRKIETRLDDLRREMNRLNVIEERRFFRALPTASNREAKIASAEPSNPSIVPELADNPSVETHSGSDHNRR
jgi:hypothetical protein